MIKEFHKSKNLSSVSSLDDISWASINNTLTTIINALDVGTYTMSFTVELTRRNDTQDDSVFGVRSLLPSSSNPIILEFFQWGTSDVGTIKQASFTITVTAQRKGNFGNVYFYGCGNNTTGATGKANFSKIMLNTGSTALPYEPYGDTWNTKSYVKSISGEQTYTKFPIVLRTTEQSIPTWNVKGNMQQNGAPTPQNPIQPQECGERTTNLMRLYKTGYAIDVNGNEVQNSDFSIYEALVDTSVLQYTLAGTSGASNRTIRIHEYNGNSWISQIIDTTGANLPITFTKSSTANRILISIYANNYNMRLTASATSMPYEPYGYKLDIKSANTTTPVYLGEVESTRQINKLVLTGEEGWTVTSNGVMRIGIAGQNRSISPISTHYIGANTGAWSDIQDKTITVSIAGYLAIKDTTYTTTTNFKQYLADQYANGTPVTVWYVLATETTGVVNEPIRKIGNYADAITNPVSIPTTLGLNTIDVATTLKPSEISLTYDGYKVCKRQKYDNGSWD